MAGDVSCVNVTAPDWSLSGGQHQFIMLPIINKVCNHKGKHRSQVLWPSVGSIAGQRLRRWPAIEPTLGNTYCLPSRECGFSPLIK